MRKTYSNVLIALLKGIVYSHQEEIWNTLMQPEHERDVRNYFADIHLDVIIDKAEGYADDDRSLFTFHSFACCYANI